MLDKITIKLHNKKHCAFSRTKAQLLLRWPRSAAQVH